MRHSTRMAAATLALSLLVPLPARPADEERSLKLEGYVQARHTPLDQSEEEKNSFLIRRLRLKASGSAFKDVRYEVQIGNVNGALLDPDRLRLLDANVCLDFSPRVRLRVGQFKAPFGREILTSGRDLESIERSLVEGLVPGRQIGAMVTSASTVPDLAHGAKGRIDYGVGVFNGNGINTPRNDNSDVMLAGRVVARVGERGISVGGGAFTSKDSAGVSFATIGQADVGRRIGIGADVRMDGGFLVVQGELAQVRFDPEDDAISSRTLRALSVQPSLFLFGEKRLQVFGQLDWFDDDTSSEDDRDKQWIHVGANYYLKGHAYKLQAEYVLKGESGDGFDDDVARVQLQVAW